MLTCCHIVQPCMQQHDWLWATQTARIDGVGVFSHIRMQYQYSWRFQQFRFDLHRHQPVLSLVY